MENVTIRISNIETVFTQDKKESLISFLGRVLFNASLASSKDATENQTATVNGKVYTFKNKVINVNVESLPRFERLSFAGNGEILKPNFVGFVLNTLFSNVTDFKGLHIHKNKAINDAATKGKSLQQVTAVLLAEYKERQLKQRNDILQGEKIALSYGIGKNIETLRKENKQLAAEIKTAKTAPVISAAKVLNDKTREKRNSNNTENPANVPANETATA